MKFVKKLLLLFWGRGALELAEFDHDDKDRRKKFIKRMDEYEDPNKWRFWLFILPLFAFWIFEDFVGQWPALIYFHVLGIYISFILPFSLFRNIEKKYKEDWRKRRICILLIFSTWICTALHLVSFALRKSTIFEYEIYLSAALVSLFILANIFSTVYAYTKYIRALKGAVNEKTGTIWSEDDIWLLSSQKYRLFNTSLALVSLIVLIIWGEEVLPTLLNVFCMCWSLICPIFLWKNIDRNYMGPKLAKNQTSAHLVFAWLLLLLNALSMFIWNPVFNIYIIYLQQAQIALLVLANICFTVILRRKYRQEFVLHKKVEEEINTTNNVLQ